MVRSLPLSQLTINPKMTVEAKAPRNPSHVFLGESLIRRVRPKKNPVRVCVCVCVVGGGCVCRGGGGWEGGMCGYMGGGVATRTWIIHNTLHGTTSFKASGACPRLANGEQGGREAMGCGREGREGGRGGREGREGGRGGKEGS